MLQHKLTLAPGAFAFALVGISWVISTGAVRASEKCLTAPNAPAPRDEHWYYRTDRATNRQCWYLVSRTAGVRKRTTEPKTSMSQSPLPPEVPPSTPWPNGTARDGAPDASEPATNLLAPESAISGPEPAKLADVSPSFRRKTPRSIDPTSLTPAPASDRTDQPHSVTPVQDAVTGPSPVLVITLALLALFGPTYHTVRWLRRRRARHRWNAERQSWSIPNESDTRPKPGPYADSPEQIAETLHLLLSEMRTKLYETSDAVEPRTERELDQISGTNHGPKIGVSASSH